jgi:hypothetical protein
MQRHIRCVTVSSQETLPVDKRRISGHTRHRGGSSSRSDRKFDYHKTLYIRTKEGVAESGNADSRYAKEG